MPDKKARIAVLVSGGGTNLQALLDAQENGTLASGEIVLVISNKSGVFALERARRAGVPAMTVLKSGPDGREAFERSLTAALEEARADLIILAGFLAILSPRFTEHFAGRIINVHPSLIPAFCGEGYYGLKVHEAALARGVRITGATVHFVNEIPDGGEIILQKAVRIRPGDTPERLQRRVMRQAEWKILPAAAEMLCAKIIEEKEKEH